MTELTGYRHITEALERWRAAGLYLPCDSAASRQRLQQVWLERYKATDAGLFMECVKFLAAGTHFPRLYDMDVALAEVRARHKMQARLTDPEAAKASTRRPDCDVENSKQRVRQIINHLQQKYTVSELKTDF